MSQHYSNSKQAFYSTEFFKVQSMPKDVEVVSVQQAAEILNLLNAQNNVRIIDGIITHTPLPSSGVEERAWRDFELSRADVELYKVQDSDKNAKGSVSDWRAYRKALRDWPENPNFPEKNLRPKAPSAE